MLRQRYVNHLGEIHFLDDIKDRKTVENLEAPEEPLLIGIFSLSLDSDKSAWNGSLAHYMREASHPGPQAEEGGLA